MIINYQPQVYHTYYVKINTTNLNRHFRKCIYPGFRILVFSTSRESKIFTAYMVVFSNVALCFRRYWTVRSTELTLTVV